MGHIARQSAGMEAEQPGGVARARRGWVAAAVAVALVAGVVAAAVLVGRDDRQQARTLVAVADTLAYGNTEYHRLRVLDGRTGQVVFATKPGRWAGPRFSPDGRYLSAFSFDEDGHIALRVFDLRHVSSGARDFELPSEGPLGLEWAPDSSLLAVAGRERLIVLRPNARVAWETSISLPQLPPHQRFSGHGVLWSPDSRYLAYEMNGLVLVADRRGRSVARHTTADLTGGDYNAVQQVSWDAAGRLVVAVRLFDPERDRAFALGPVAGGRWEEVATSPAPANDAEAVREDLVSRAPGGYAKWEGKTADGSATVASATTPLAQGSPVGVTRLLVGAIGRWETLNVTIADYVGRSTNFDVVIVGGN